MKKPSLARQRALPTLKRAKKRAWDAFSLWVRKSNADWAGNVKCFTCTTIKHYKEMDAGHFIHNKLDYDEYNIHVQCTSCNRYKSGNWVVYYERMKELYGQEVIDDLMSRKNDIMKYKVADYLEIEAKYKERLKEL